MKIKELFVGKTDSTFVQFFRYIFVGGGATVVQWGLLILFRELVGLDANIANMIGFAGGLVSNYLVSKLWVFDEESTAVKNKGAEFTAFCIIGIVGFGINQGLVWLFDKPLARAEVFGDIIPADKYYLIGQVAATGIAFFWNFFARKFLLYNKKEQPAHEATEK